MNAPKMWNRQIGAGVQGAEMPLGLQIGGQPDRQRIGAALRARHHQRDLERGREIWRLQHGEGLREAVGVQDAPCLKTSGSLMVRRIQTPAALV